MFDSVRPSASRLRRAGSVAAIACLLATSGCRTSYREESDTLRHYWSQGQVSSAARVASKRAEARANSSDAIIWRLEQGVALRANEEFAGSNEAFQHAETKIEQFEKQADVRVGQELTSTFVNLARLPYEAYAYDKIMLNTYKALNYLELGEPEKARVELNRTQQRQEAAVQENAQRIERMQTAAKRQNPEIDKLQNSSVLERQLKNHDIFPSSARLKAYRDYVNPFSVYLSGLFFMSHPTGQADLERAHQAFERVAGMISNRSAIDKDFSLLEKIRSGESIPPTTYVFFETGQAPIRDQVRIDIPLFLVTEELPYIGAAFPKLEFRDRYASTVRITADNQTEETELLADIDAIVAQNFENRLPAIVARTLTATIVKATATYGLQEGAEAAGLPRVLGTLLGAGYQFAVNTADLRTWSTLPKQIQFCRIATPPDRKLKLSVPYGTEGTKTIALEEGVLNVVFVKSITPAAPLLVTQFRLK